MRVIMLVSLIFCGLVGCSTVPDGVVEETTVDVCDDACAMLSASWVNGFPVDLSRQEFDHAWAERGAPAGHSFCISQQVRHAFPADHPDRVWMTCGSGGMPAFVLTYDLTSKEILDERIFLYHERVSDE